MVVRLLVTFLFLYFCTDAIAHRGNRNTSSKFVTLPEHGTLKASISKTAWSKLLIYQFLGVRYAESPSGTRRFKSPVPVQPWNGIRDASKFGRKCPTLRDLSSMTEEYRNAEDHEDCLNMAIYSPNLAGSLPVMVYVHGGSFYLQSAIEYPPNYLLQSDIVLVVVQYRLDALGFLSTNSKEIPGNAALMDVQLALNFVKKNIKYFGGNPNNVTLFGQSAGAVIVSTLSISPAMPDDLFHRAIIQSGSIFSQWGTTANPVGDARNIAKFAGLNSTQSLSSLNNCFLNMSLFDLLNAVDKYQKDLSGGPLKLGARSISIGGPSNYLPDLPQKIVSSPQYNKSVPMIVGTTKDDGSYLATIVYQVLQSHTSPEKLPIVSTIMQMMCTFLNVGGKCEKLKSVISETFWTPEEVVSNDFSKIATGLIDMLGMFFFKIPAMQMALTNSKSNETNTFLYTFDYEGQNTRFGYGEDTSQYPFKGGVTHSNENIYIFPYPSDVANLNTDDALMSHELLNLWTSFAANGRPHMAATFHWPPVNSDKFGPYARINKKVTIEQDYPNEFVRNISEKRQINVWPLLKILSDFK
ncbi:Glutactin [Pseudolycoriella hygida]|uniref:Carboxylic ester hydrolase n=1 Tax=Pseudolycoriella hygida TaxID=35572 RepID=A0A9Q0SA56_9DIPT|nr:Glutactin [Pseudolycoriella hygida]